MARCTRCGSGFSADDRYCLNCGPTRVFSYGDTRGTPAGQRLETPDLNALTSDYLARIPSSGATFWRSSDSGKTSYRYGNELEVPSEYVNMANLLIGRKIIFTESNGLDYHFLIAQYSSEENQLFIDARAFEKLIPTLRTSIIYNTYRYLVFTNIEGVQKLQEVIITTAGR